jgi:hypothetical protein
MGLSRNTVRRLLDRETPIGVGGATAKAAPVREVVEPRLEALLARTAGATGGKQRLTATRLHWLLAGEGTPRRRHASQEAGGGPEAAGTRGIRSALVPDRRSRRG